MHANLEGSRKNSKIVHRKVLNMAAQPAVYTGTYRFALSQKRWPKPKGISGNLINFPRLTVWFDFDICIVILVGYSRVPSSPIRLKSVYNIIFYLYLVLRREF